MKYNIIIPYRKRKEHLNEFITRFTGFIKEHQLDIQIYVIEQLGADPFNRGALLNIGFLEACVTRPEGLMIFHDVDLYPTYWGSIRYEPRPHEVRHPIGTPLENVGGICCCWKKEYELVNGHPSYAGWGKEDTTFRSRLERHGIHIDETDIVPLYDTKRCYAPSHSRNVYMEGESCRRNTEAYHQEMATGISTNGLSSLSYNVYGRYDSIEYVHHMIVEIMKND